MKKIDKLILSSFLGPFILTFLVVVFILLLVNMIKYFDDIIGKGLEWDVLGTLLFYFAVSVTPQALPLGILLSSLITYGNLGEHFELTAVKSLGISLVRSLAPIFAFTLALTYFAFLSNNYMVPKAALETYSLLYDIKQKKPALDLREGEFYNGIPDISIKVAKKFKDGVTLRDVIIYDHRGRNGNKQVTIADSGKMYTIFNDQYLKLELFRGYIYDEGSSGQDLSGRMSNEETFSKTKFDKTEIVFDLSSFGMIRTDKKWFASNRIMRNMSQLQTDMDSVNREVLSQGLNVHNMQRSLFVYHFKKDSVPMSPDLKGLLSYRDSVSKARKKDTVGVVKPPHFQSPSNGGIGSFFQQQVKYPSSILPKHKHLSDSIFKKDPTSLEINFALGRVRMAKSQLQNANAQTDSYQYEYRVFEIQWHKIMANSIACIAMFLIGAPLGAIIKKGGLGVPVIASIFFFIVFYVLSLMGEKWAKAETTPMIVGMWLPNVILFSIGFVFLRQARADARLFDADFYNVAFDNFKKRFPAVFKVKSEPG
jgi:lipopolysaccharide export system permease protein